MAIQDHLTEFEGFSVVDYSLETGILAPDKNAYRLSLSYDASDAGETFEPLLASFVGNPTASQVQALIIGDWGQSGTGNDSAPVVEALVSARAQLPALRHLFLGEITMEEAEISWINQSDVSPLFEAFPDLEVLYLRGGNELRLGRPRHKNLRKLVVETGGMPAAIVRDVTAADLPKLEHLELWLGDDGYGNDITADDIRALLNDGPCRHLTYLGLRDDCSADQTAQVLADVGVPKTLEVLDLSLGTLSDEGALALAKASWLKQLKNLNIRHHYVSENVVSQLQSIVPYVNADDVQEPDDWDGKPHRYVAVSE